MIAAPLPPDVAAYLVQAAIQIAEEQGFQPENEEAMRQWLQANTQAVGERAQEAMADFANTLLTRQDIMDAAAEHIAADIHRRVNANPGPKQYNPRYVQYATAHNCTPEQMLERDGHKMTNFLCWNMRR